MATITKASVYERFSETEVCFRDLEKFFETDWDNINDNKISMRPGNENDPVFCKITTEYMFNLKAFLKISKKVTEKILSTNKL